MNGYYEILNMLLDALVTTESRETMGLGKFDDIRDHVSAEMYFDD